METKQAILPLSAPVSISMLLCFGNRHNHITVCDETYFYFIDDIVPASKAFVYTKSECLLGHSPIPCPSQKFLLRLRVLQTLSPALATCLVYVQGRACAKHKKKRAGFRGLTSSEPDSSSFISQKIFQLVPKIAALIRLHDKKKSLAKIIGLWHNGSRTIFQAD